MNKSQRKFVNDAMNRIGKLNPWERKFIVTLSKLPDTYHLTVPQNKKLNQISSSLNET